MGRKECLDCLRWCFPCTEITQTDDVDYGDTLMVNKVDPCISANGKDHHTSQYDVMRRTDPHLVVRRGQPFMLNITLNRPYSRERDVVTFIFTADGETKPSYGHRTIVAVSMEETNDNSLPWGISIEKAEDCTLLVQITPPADCVVAKWHLDITTKLADEDKTRTYSWNAFVYILYNPWCKLDQVYLESNEWRDEAVLNDVGALYTNTASCITTCPWRFDQFDTYILDCALYLVHSIGEVRGNSRSDPILTSRALAAAVNCNDDNGVLVGNWSCDCRGGTAPTAWMGSKTILQQYYLRKRPVRYAQCWVFGGVLTTVCRAIGIPCRPITNYSSAHDGQGSLTVDYFVDTAGNVVNTACSESMWNFHVWNEVWMKRPDLGTGYGGWQAIDATPQERSQGIFRTGPASVTAIKQGEIQKPYDTGFLYAEVNADVVYWLHSGPNKPIKLISRDTSAVGKLVVTKAPYKMNYEDVTHSYKYPEQSIEERAIMFQALKQCQNTFSRHYLNQDFNDIKFELKMINDIIIGQSFKASIVMKNNDKTKNYRVRVILKVNIITYTGKVAKTLKSDDRYFRLNANSTGEVELPVSYAEYSKRLTNNCAFNITCLASVEGTHCEYYQQNSFQVRKPEIKIALLGRAFRGTEGTAQVTLLNPLPVPLTKGKFMIEGSGLRKPLVAKIKNNVAPGDTASVNFKFIPPSVGKASFTAKFVSKELDNIDGVLIFDVGSQ